MTTNWVAAPSTGQDAIVMRTAEDAVTTKYAAVQAGYYKDPFIAGFAEKKQKRPVQVIIKRGTFARVAVIFKAISRFTHTVANSANRAQIVVLGAGKDTSFFRLIHQSDSANLSLHWFEIDHPQVLEEKAASIEKSKNLFKASVRRNGKTIELRSSSGNEWPASCHLISFDLHNDPSAIIDMLVNLGLQKDSPTLLVSECLQMYLPVDTVNDLLKTFTGTLSDCHICSYEPIVLFDSFGKMMEFNLTKAGVTTPTCGFLQLRTLQSYLQHMQAAGFGMATGCDMHTAFETIIPATDRQLANRCEFLDELEEWMLIMRHYCFVVASTNSTSIVGQSFCKVGSSGLLGFVSGRCEELRNEM
jgi:O-methyltransferase involved in polyketide biosynthesis